MCHIACATPVARRSVANVEAGAGLWSGVALPFGFRDSKHFARGPMPRDAASLAMVCYDASDRMHFWRDLFRSAVLTTRCGGFQLNVGRVRPAPQKCPQTLFTRHQKVGDHATLYKATICIDLRRK